jgi:hypothetical protein
MKKIIVLFLLFLVLVIVGNAQKKDFSLTNKDKTAIVRMILTDYDLQNRNLMLGESRNTIYLSSKNIRGVRLPEIEGIKFVLLNSDRLTEAKETGLVYCKFGRFSVRKSKVTIRFGFYKIGESRGVILTIKKVKDQWQVVANGGFGSAEIAAY